MDKLIDHLFVFEGEGAIRDFPGNYSQYREWQREEERAARQVKEEPSSTTPTLPEQASQKPVEHKSPQKLSFKEKRELELLEKELPALEEEKQKLELEMSSGAMDYEDLQKAGDRIAELVRLLDEHEMRWLELSERQG